VIRYAALLRGTESAWQALSYGLESIPIFGEIGGVYMNFGLWGIAIFPAWLVLRHFGAGKDDGVAPVVHDGSEAGESGSQGGSNSVEEAEGTKKDWS